MSSNKGRKARRQAERDRWEREQQAEAAARRRRTALLSVASAGVAVVVVVGLLVLLTRGDGEPDPAAEGRQATDSELIESEEAGEAQGAAANAARDAGELIAEDYTVAPGTPVEGRERPPSDDRPVACGAAKPANVRASRPRYPGGPAEVLKEGVDYVARIETSCGPIVIDLLEEDSPIAVNSFVFLARQRFFDGLEMYRDYGAIAAVQSGSGTNAAGWDIGYLLPDELRLAEREGYPIGTVTTAGTGPYTAGSEFYIVYGDEFDTGFAADPIQTTFGRVLSGLDVIGRATAMDRVGMGGETFAKRVFMTRVTIQER